MSDQDDVDDRDDLDDLEDPDEDDEELPEIDEDERADISAVAEQVEQQAGAGADEDDESDQDDVDDRDDLDDVGMDPDRTSIGDVYCNMLGMGAAVAREQWGSGVDGDRKEVLDEYAQIAEDLEIDEAVDDWIDEHGGPDELTPAQTIIVMTTMWAGMVVMDDPEIIEGLSEMGGE